MIDPHRLLYDSGRWCAVFGGLCTLGTWITLGGGIALGVALGVALGWLNLWLLARALGQTIPQAELYRGRKWAIPAAILLKWPLVLLVIAGVALYTPARAEGLALGFAIALVSATLAALRGQSSVASPRRPTSGTDDSGESNQP